MHEPCNAASYCASILDEWNSIGRGEPELRHLHPSARSLLLWSLSTCRTLIVPPCLPQFQQLPGPSSSGACPLAELSLCFPVFPSFSSCQVPPPLEPVHLQYSHCASLSSPVSAAARSLLLWSLSTCRALIVHMEYSIAPPIHS